MNFKTSASFIVTEHCSLCCKYCFEVYDRKVGQDMTEGVAYAALKYLFDQANMCPTQKRVDVTLFGGEPLMRPDMCDYIITEGIKLSKEYKIGFSAGIITNGTIMTDEIELMMYRWKAQIPFSIQVSVDGDKEAQDLYRVKKDGSSSFADVEKNIEKFRRIDPRLCLHGCLNRKTMPMLYKSYRYFVDEWKHRGSIWFMPVHTEDWQEKDIKTYDEQLSMIFLHETNKLNTISLYTPINKYLPCGGVYRHPTKTCGAGTSYISFCGNGDIYPCHNFYFSAEKRNEYLKAGNVLENPVISNPEIFTPFEEVTQEVLGCDKCICTSCYRCYADNWTYNGDITKQVGKGGVRCELSKVEQKYQLAAVKWAEAHVPKKNQTNTCQAKLPEKIPDATLDKIIDVLDNVNGVLNQLDGRIAILEGCTVDAEVQSDRTAPEDSGNTNSCQ